VVGNPEAIFHSYLNRKVNTVESGATPPDAPAFRG
jgi:hypothetical protein